MITIKNATTINGATQDLQIKSEQERIIDASGLTLMPAVIDPHVHFRTPGMEYKEDWRTGAKAAMRGGCSMVFDMPNTIPATITAYLLQEKKALIDKQLKEAGIPLRYQLFVGADKLHLQDLPEAKNHCIGIKVFMGCSTGNLVVDDDESLHAVFSLAAEENMLVAVHAEDEAMMHENKIKYKKEKPAYSLHSLIRDIPVAVKAVDKAISLTKQYGNKLYILHVSSADEVALIKTAKAENLSVYAETTPHHLFFNTHAYAKLKGKAVVNPPLRDEQHQEILFKAINDKIIDTIGSDHAPHTIEEKNKVYGECPSGMPGIEFTLPLLLNAYHEGKITLENIIALTSTRAREIFNIPSYEDYVLVDLEKIATVTKTASKCAWTPYQDLTLKGWPLYTIANGHCFDIE